MGRAHVPIWRARGQGRGGEPRTENPEPGRLRPAAVRTELKLCPYFHIRASCLNLTSFGILSVRMPTYEYRCLDCQHQYEKREGFDAPALQECPSCGGTARRVLQATAVVFKGSGFYKTDSRKPAGEPARSAPEAESAAKTESTGDDGAAKDGPAPADGPAKADKPAKDSAGEAAAAS